MLNDDDVEIGVGQEKEGEGFWLEKGSGARERFGELVTAGVEQLRIMDKAD